MLVRVGAREGRLVGHSGFLTVLRLSAPGRGGVQSGKGRFVSGRSHLLPQNKACGLKVKEYHERVLNFLDMEVVDDRKLRSN